MKIIRSLFYFALAAILLAAGNLQTQSAQAASSLAETPTVFAVIGDYGKGSAEEADVAALVKSWNPEFIVTLGDNNYPVGSALDIDTNIGQYYHEFIYPYQGGYGAGADTNRFFPALGNHDWMTDSAQPYLDYFTLPGNERYYAFTRGSTRFFILDSDPNEPDGNDAASVQAEWLRNELSASTAAFNLVIAHHAPYSSGQHGSNSTMQWPFKQWGADAVLAGHDHTYERLNVNGLTYFVNGLGGSTLYAFNNVLPESQVRFNADYGAMRVEMTASRLQFQFFDRLGQLQDSFVLDKIQTLKAFSNAAHDGMTLELADPLNIGGAANSSATIFKLGDDLRNRQYRAILSFNTASLPENAIITRAMLKIRKQGLTGTNPFTILGSLTVDMRKPSFGAIGLSASDFQATAGRTAVATFGATPVNNWYSAILSGVGRNYINKAGVTQFRLYFATDDNNDNAADYMKFFSGDYANTNVRPTLIIEYYVP